MNILCRVGLHRWHHYRVERFWHGGWGGIDQGGSDYRKRCVREGCAADHRDSS